MLILTNGCRLTPSKPEPMYNEDPDTWTTDEEIKQFLKGTSVDEPHAVNDAPYDDMATLGKLSQELYMLADVDNMVTIKRCLALLAKIEPLAIYRDGINAGINVARKHMKGIY